MSNLGFLLSVLSSLSYNVYKNVICGVMLLAMTMPVYVSAAVLTSEVDSASPLSWRISSYIEDPSKQLTLDDVIESTSWVKQNPSSIPSFGFSSSAYWLKLDVENQQQTPLIQHLNINVSWLDEIDVFHVYQQHTIAQISLGDKRPYQAQYSPLLTPSIPLTLLSGHNQVYIRIASVEAIVVPLNIQSPDITHRDNARYSGYFGAIYGMLILIAIYNLILAMSLKKTLYYFYVLYVLAFVLGSLSYNGAFYHFLLSSGSETASAIHPHLFFIFQFAGLLFVAKFIKSRQQFPKIHKVFLVFSGLAILIQLTILLVDLPYFAQSISVLFSTVFAGILLFTCFYIIQSKGLATRLLILGILSSVVGNIVISLTVFGVIPFSFATFHALEIGFVLDAALLSLALAANMKLIISQKQAMQLELIEQKNRVNQQLEEQVKVRTQKLEDANKQLKEVAIKDELTQVLNRLGSNQQLDKMHSFFKRYKTVFSLIMFDLDFFKQVNDQHGHIVGDEILVAFANILRKNSRECDYVGRWGGEEFIIICPETDLQGGLELATNIKNALNSQALVRDIKITTSIGVAQIAENESLHNLLQRTDAQLYLAKAQGRNTISPN